MRTTAAVLSGILLVAFGTVSNAQETKVSGYIQAEWQHYDQSDIVGGRALYSSPQKNIFTIRRGRVKIKHSSGIMTGVVQVDMTERGVALTDAYMSFDLLEDKVLSATVGLFDRPNPEVQLSSSKRESPERAQIIREYYPKERDIGFKFTTEPLVAESFRPQLQVGLFNGPGPRPETDPYKDLIARLVLPLPLGEDSPVSVSVGGSVYYGGIPQIGDSVLKTENGVTRAVAGDASGDWKGWGNRSNFNVEGEVAADLLPFGVTTVRGEWITGTLPSLTSRDIAPNQEELIIQVRDQMGYYVYLIQEIGEQVQLVGKYDFYDRNTELEGAQVDALGDRTLDYAAGVLGFGINIFVDQFRFTAWYEIPSFAADENLTRDIGGAVLDGNDVRDNKTTLRFQYKF